MQNPFSYSLGDFQIGAADTQIGTPILRLHGMTALTVAWRFAGGTGGTSIKAYIQTSLDNGSTWVDILCIALANTPEAKVANLSGLTPKTTPADMTEGALADDTALDGVLGDRIRAKVVSTGTYTGDTRLDLDIVAR